MNVDFNCNFPIFELKLDEFEFTVQRPAQLRARPRASGNNLKTSDMG